MRRPAGTDISGGQKWRSRSLSRASCTHDTGHDKIKGTRPLPVCSVNKDYRNYQVVSSLRIPIGICCRVCSCTCHDNSSTVTPFGFAIYLLLFLLLALLTLDCRQCCNRLQAQRPALVTSYLARWTLCTNTSNGEGYVGGVDGAGLAREQLLRHPARTPDLWPAVSGCGSLGKTDSRVRVGLEWRY